MVPIIALRWGWQAAFIIAGIAGFAWLLLWLPFFSLPQKSRFVSKQELTHIQEGQENEAEEKRTPWLQLLQFRQSWAIMALKFFTDPVWWFFLIWLPDFFKTTRGLDIKSSWFYLSTIYAIITILSIAGGWLTGRLMQRGWSHTRARKTMMLICACCVLPILGVSKLESFVALVLSGHASSVAAATNWLIVIIIGVAGAAHQAWSANVFTTVSDVFPKKSVGSMVGIAGMSGCISSIIFPIVCGRVLDYYKHQATIGYGILFGICAVAYLLALGVAHLISPHFDPVTAKDQNSKPSHP
jgi:ACS family hexuronate transporter-like MFS transporter